MIGPKEMGLEIYVLDKWSIEAYDEHYSPHNEHRSSNPRPVHFSGFFYRRDKK